MAKKTFESALTRLEQLAEELETGELSLDKSLEKFNEGMTLVQFCNDRLDEARDQVELLLKKNGELAGVPFVKDDSGDNNLPE
ncbi:MAG: exodeoxyribonuclease VII small subunit [Desulfobulbus sp.]|jgi:exodeoxyribonuclease VII small subunit